MSEPAALAALALLANERADAARRPLEWLANLQSTDGSLGVCALLTAPGWPTSLAVLAWQAARGTPAWDEANAAGIDRGVAWLLERRGVALPLNEEMGHDSTLVGWSWAEGTHSWVEPTAWAVLALRATGRDEHPRAQEAVRLLVDRLLPTGGCNYGNTVVLGQLLRPHLQPTGLCLWAIARMGNTDPRIAASIRYLESELGPHTPTASLCYGLLGLAAHDRRPATADGWLAAAAARTLKRDPSAHKLALLALAAAPASATIRPPYSEATAQ